MTTLQEAARAVLLIADARAKAEAGHALAVAWRSGTLALGAAVAMPQRPARPERPPLVPPRGVKKRKVTAAPAGRIALLHALAHIELNAIDLAADLVGRFDAPAPAFADDWVRVLDEEAKHFLLLSQRLAALGAGYGDLPAHDGLWQTAEATQHDLLARLAVVPLVLEARGLDVTPAMIARLDAVGDGESAAALRIVYRDEIGHVAVGRRWFETEVARRGLPARETWQALVRQHFKGALKPPFNDEARTAAGLSADFYAGLAA